MNSYRNSLFISVITLILFYQLIHKKFYGDSYIDNLLKENTVLENKYTDTYKTLIEIGSSNGYTSEGEWVLGINGEEFVNTFFWNRVDSVLYNVIDEAFEKFRRRSNVSICPDDKTIFIVAANRYTNEINTYEFEGVEVYCLKYTDYRETLKKKEPYVKYDIHFYAKDLETTSIVWSSTPRVKTTYSTSGPPKDFLYFDNPKIKAWQKLKMERPIFRTYTAIFTNDYSFQKDKIKLSDVPGEEGLTFSTNPCTDEEKSLDLDTIKRLPDHIVEMSNYRRPCFQIQENSIDTLFGDCKKFDYDYK